MDVIIIFNGLGNQMSQYAFYLQKKQLNQSTYYIPFCHDHNGLELNHIFNINFKQGIRERLLYLLFRVLLTNQLGFIGKCIKWFFGLLNFKIVKEDFNYNYQPELMKPSKGITFFYGGWHTEKYFSGVSHQIRKDFEFKIPNDIDNQNLITQIQASNSIAIHVRRGDYLNSQNIGLFGGVCTKSYYQTAVDLMELRHKDCHFFVFSNDIEWTKKNLNIKAVTYVTCNAGINSWKDMYLMSICKHQIIANSTFSWWGAWLNKNIEKHIISPTRFLNNDLKTDVYSDDWEKLSNY